jgi:uncharacterized integral membrane protein
MASTKAEERVSNSEESFSARRAALSAILLLLLILLILLLVAAATERTDILRFAGAVLWPSGAVALQPRLGVALLAEAPVTRSGPALPVAQIDERFRGYYERWGGAAALGQPISPAVEHNGRTVQWFEAARLELAPEHAGGPFEIQRGRLGAEYTARIAFPQQAPFADRPGARYFAATGHGLAEPFLSAWEQAGGVEALGYPISDQLQEILPDDTIATTQYFERGRLEVADDGVVRLGMLGRALLLDQPPPQIIPAARPTSPPAP